MATTANKVKFNISNVHYAPITAQTGTEATTFGTPVALPGAVSISLDAQGEINKFYADGVAYYTSNSNNGYEGDLEMALVDDAFRQAVLNEAIDSNKVLAETVANTAKPFALGFQIDGDQNSTLFWFVNCTATRPAAEADTNEDSIEPKTDTMTVSCTPDPYSKVVRYKTTAETTSSVISAWWSSVYAGATTKAS